MPFTVLMIAPQGVRVGRHQLDPIGRLIGELDAGLTEAGHRVILVADRGSASAREFVALPEGRGPLLYAAVEEIRALAPVDLVHVHHPGLVDELPQLGVPFLVTLHDDPAELPPSVFTWRRRVYLHCTSAWQRARCPPRTPLLHDIAPGLSPRHGRPLVRPRTPRIVAIGARAEHVALQAIAESAGLAPLWIDEPLGWRRFIAGTTALWLPTPSLSRWSCAVDAMLSGTPVLTARDGALAELIEEGITGRTYADASDFQEALTTCALLDRRACARAARERFAPSAMVGRYLAAYGALAGRGAWVHVANDAQVA